MKITRTLCLYPILAVAVTAAIVVPVLTLAVEASPQNHWPPLPGGGIKCIAFGSCAKQWQYQSIWKTVIATQPDLFIFVGDAVDADTNGNTGFRHPIRLGELRGSMVTGEQEMVTCPEPRPQVCTQDYRPVCAKLKDGSIKTYSNGCIACTDPAVTGFREGACE
jgi:hypothetical protein